MKPIIDGRCERCGQPYQADGSQAGQGAQCERCGHKFNIPLASPAARTHEALSTLAAQAKPSPGDGGAPGAGLSAAIPVPAPSRSPTAGLVGPVIVAGLIGLGIGFLLATPARRPAPGQPLGAAKAQETSPNAGSSAPASTQPAGGSNEPGPALQHLPAAVPVLMNEAASPQEQPPFREIVYPAVAGDWMASLAIGRSGDIVDLWSLDPLKRQASLRFDATASSYALSGDGRHLARLVGASPGAVEVWSFSPPKRVHRFDLPRSQRSELVGFCEAGRLVLRNWLGIGVNLEVWDVQGGRMVCRIPVPSWSRSGFAFSPDGRTVARAASSLDGAELQFYDLRTGEARRSAPLPGARGGLGFVAAGAAFSHDAKRVSVLYADQDRAWRIATFQADTSDRTGEARLAVVKTWEARADRPGVLSWLPDDSGWLAFGDFIIDEQTGNVVSRLGVEEAFSQRFVGRWTCHLVVPQGRKLELKTVELDARRRNTIPARPTTNKAAEAGLPAEAVLGPSLPRPAP